MTFHCGILDLRHLPVPAGATADDWHDPSGHVEDVSRTLTWSIHDAGGFGAVAVQGEQYADGTVHRGILTLPELRDAELGVGDARRLAAALLDAADVMAGLQ